MSVVASGYVTNNDISETKDVHQISSGGLEFKHPEDIDGEWKEGKCNECHEGVPM